MLKNKINRHTLAFLTIALDSVFLYPIVKTGLTTVTWIFLGLVIMAALITLMTK
jgi:hypothetical protein